jgi:hypothetical protein
MHSDYELVDVIIALQERGFNHDFIIENEHIRCLQYNELIAPDDFEIMETHHCECCKKYKNGSLLYAIRLMNYDVKGILMSNYQSYLKGMSIQLWAKFDHVLRNGQREMIGKDLLKISKVNNEKRI